MDWALKERRVGSPTARNLGPGTGTVAWSRDSEWVGHEGTGEAFSDVLGCILRGGYDGDP